MIPENSTHKLIVEFEIGGRLSHLMEKNMATIEQKLDSVLTGISDILTAIKAQPGTDNSAVLAGIQKIEDVLGEDAPAPAPAPAQPTA